MVLVCVLHFVDAILVRWRGIIRDVPSSMSGPAIQERPAGGWPAELPPTVKSVECKEEKVRERERERERAWGDNRFFLIVLIPHFIPLHAICPFCPCQAQGSMKASNIFSDFIWLASWILKAASNQGSKSGDSSEVRNPTWEANLAPLQRGDKYFPNTFCVLCRSTGTKCKLEYHASLITDIIP